MAATDGQRTLRRSSGIVERYPIGPPEGLTTISVVLSMAFAALLLNEWGVLNWFWCKVAFVASAIGMAAYALRVARWPPDRRV